MLTSNDVIERRRVVAKAVANQRLEGLEPDSRTVADLERAADGELIVSDVLRTLHARIAAGEFRSSPAR